MHRHAALGVQPGSSLHLGLADEESLILQLCEHLYATGFLFDDASASEVFAGQSVIDDFFEQEGDWLSSLIPAEALQKFLLYAQEHAWNEKEAQAKLRARVLKAFDQLARGAHHAFNVRRNLHLGLVEPHQHTELRDFILYLTAYYRLILAPPETLPTQKFTVQDILKLRGELMNKMGQHKFIEMLLKDISRKRGGHLPHANRELLQQTQRKHVRFVRPSQTLAGELPLPAHLHWAKPEPGKPEAKNAPSREVQEASASPRKAPSPGTPKAHAVAQPPEEEDLMDDEEELSENQTTTDSDSDVIYGTGHITQEAMMEFVMRNPASALKFLFRKDLDGRLLSVQMNDIYLQWEKRGLRRNQVRGYLLELMDWSKFPEESLNDLLNQINDKIYDLMH